MITHHHGSQPASMPPWPEHVEEEEEEEEEEDEDVCVDEEEAGPLQGHIWAASNMYVINPWEWHHMAPIVNQWG